MPSPQQLFLILLNMEGIVFLKDGSIINDSAGNYSYLTFRISKVVLIQFKHN